MDGEHTLRLFVLLFVVSAAAADAATMSGSALSHNQWMVLSALCYQRARPVAASASAQHVRMCASHTQTQCQCFRRSKDKRTG